MTLNVEAPPAPPPEAVLIHMLLGSWRMQAIAVAARLNVADQLRDGPKTAAEIAPLVGADPSALYRLMRAVAGEGLFSTDAEKRFSLTDMGRLLTSDHPRSVRGMALWTGSQLSWHTWENLQLGVQSGQTVFNQVHGRNLFEHFSDPAQTADAAIFNNAMSDFSKVEGQMVMEAYDFSKVEKVVDVAGGHGQILRQILARNPNARGVLFDLPEVVAGAKDLGDRCEVVGGSFFEPLPKGGDMYVLKHIIHDWDDAKSTDILRQVRAAIAPHGRLLLLEMVIPGDDRPYPGKLLDLEMLVMAPGGKERTEDEFRELLAGAGFRLERLVPTHGPLFVIEAVPI